MSDESEAFDPREFLVAGPLWFIAKKPLPAQANAVRLSRLILTAGGENNDIVVVFTDADLASRFLEDNNQGDRWQLLLMASRSEQSALLESLLQCGHTHLGFDMKGIHASRTFTIEQVVDGMRNRPR